MADPVTAVTTFWDLKATDVLKFVSDLISAVAWPLAAAFIVNLFKTEIIERIPRLSELTLPGGISAKFNEGLNKVEAGVNETASAEQRDVPAEDEIEPEVSAAQHDLRASMPDSQVNQSDIRSDRVALIANPTGVVMESWKSLEQVLRQSLVEIGRPLPQRLPAMVVVKSLRHGGFISHDEEVSLLEMIDLRNLVAHVPNKTVTEADAERFSLLAQRFTGKLAARIARRRTKNGSAPQS